jgi:hypothetical protein
MIEGGDTTVSQPYSPFDEIPVSRIDISSTKAGAHETGTKETDTKTKSPEVRPENPDYTHPITGPIGPFLMAPDAPTNAAGLGPISPSQLYAFMFSEVVRIEWPCIDRVWARRPLIIPARHRFAVGAIKHIHLAAWPCSMSGQGEEESGWAIDEWRHRVVYLTEKGSRFAPNAWGEDTAPVPTEALPKDIIGEGIAVGLWVAIIGSGTRINRIGYTWTAYVNDPTCAPWPAKRWPPKR